MKIFKPIALCSTAVLLFTLGGCEREGPAEQAGEELDQAVEEMQQRAEETRDKAMKKLEQAGDEIEEATDESAR